MKQPHKRQRRLPMSDSVQNTSPHGWGALISSPVMPALREVPALEPPRRSKASPIRPKPGGIGDQVTSAVVRQQFKKCVRKVQDGAHVEILVHGKPVASMVPVEESRALKQLVSLFMNGKSLTIEGRTFEDLDDMATYFYCKSRYSLK